MKRGEWGAVLMMLTGMGTLAAIISLRAFGVIHAHP